MKYFRFQKPVYSLVAANSKEEAIKIYKEHDNYWCMDINTDDIIVDQESYNHLTGDEQRLMTLHLLKNNPKVRKELLEQAASKEQILIDPGSYGEYVHPENYDY